MFVFPPFMFILDFVFLLEGFNRGLILEGIFHGNYITTTRVSMEVIVTS